MPNNNIFHTEPIVQELMRIADENLKSVLGLKSIIKGNIMVLPTMGIANLVPGIWFHPTPAMTNEFDELPRVNMQTYYFRVVYVRLHRLGENLVTKANQDIATIGNTYTDKIQLPDITNLPQGTHILWATVKSVEFDPPENIYVNQIHADLTAIALNMEVSVKTRRSN